MISDTVTRVYDTRLPAPTVIRGVLGLHAPHDFDLACLVPGYDLVTELFDLPKTPEHLVDPETFRICDVVVASPTRTYVLLSAGPWEGWWRIDTRSVREPDQAEILGELTPLPGVGCFAVVQTAELRVDDLMYASGLPDGHIQVRILDVIFRSDDGRGEYALVRTPHGWYRWRRHFAHVANL